MIKKYIQIQDYPNSFGIESVATFRETIHDENMYKVLPKRDLSIIRFGTESYHILEQELTKYPKFWKPVYDDKISLYKATKCNDMYPNRILSLDAMKKEVGIGYQCGKYFDIYSVKRISTNEHFNIGDLYKNKFKIEQFEITGSKGLLVHLSNKKIISFDEL
jgi:hypothetical protein